MPTEAMHKMLGVFVTNPRQMRDILKNNDRLDGMDLELTDSEKRGVLTVLSEVGNPPGDPLEVVGTIARALIKRFPQLETPKRQ